MSQFQKKCWVCGADYTAGTAHAKYCPDCREEQYKKARLAASKRRYERVKPKGRYKTAEGTIYVCDCCGQKILARGVTTRKTCTSCLYQIGALNRRRAGGRKQLAEEVIS